VLWYTERSRGGWNGKASIHTLFMLMYRPIGRYRRSGQEFTDILKHSALLAVCLFTVASDTKEKVQKKLRFPVAFSRVSSIGNESVPKIIK